MKAIQIPGNVIEQSGLSEKEFLIELACWLYQREMLSLGQSADFAGLHRLDMQQELAKRKIELHISPQDVESDYGTLKSLKLI
jgi:predicted HTH domain antitoxin